MWLFQYYLTRRALHLLQSRVNVNSLVVDETQDESLSSYCEVVNFLLKAHATNEAIAMAYADLTGFVQSSGSSELEFVDQLWDKAIRCGSVISNQRLRSMFAEGVLPSIRAQVRNHLATHPRLTFDELANYAKALGDSIRAARNIPSVGFRISDTPKPKRWSVLTMDTDTDTSQDLTGDDHDQAALAISAQGTSSYLSPSSTRSTRPSGSITPPTSAPSIPTSLQNAVRPVGQPVSVMPRTIPMPTLCWFCLSRDHGPMDWPMIPEDSRQIMLDTRNRNYNNMNVRGLNPLTGKPRRFPLGSVPVAMVQSEYPVTPPQEVLLHHMDAAEAYSTEAAQTPSMGKDRGTA